MELFDLVKAAQKRIKSHAHVTPVMTSQTLNDITGAQIYLKCENFQRMGAFKFRGAYNAMSQLTEKQKKCGVLTYSSGNHAQAVALVGRLLEIQTVVVMPNNAPVIKREATEAYGATVVEYDPEKTTREEICRDLETRHGHTLVPPYDHINIVAGQGTAAKEFIDEVKPLDMLLVPCGGGGLLSGCAVAAKGMDPNCRVIGIEPELADDATKSFHTGKLHTVKNPPTIAENMLTTCKRCRKALLWMPSNFYFTA
jgi:threonine dehydratase